MLSQAAKNIRSPQFVFGNLRSIACIAVADRPGMDSDSIRRLPSAANPPATVEDLTAPERPIEQFEVDEQQPGDADNEDGIEYPSGAKLWLTMISLCLASFLSGLVCSNAECAVGN